MREVPWEVILKLGANAAARKFCEYNQVVIDPYTPHFRYQVKFDWSRWFSAACPAVTAHGNHVFSSYQQNKTSESKIKLRQTSKHCKRVLETPKLTHVNKTKEYINVLSKSKSAILPLFIVPDVLSSASAKVKLFAKNSSSNSDLDESGPSKHFNVGSMLFLGWYASRRCATSNQRWNDVVSGKVEIYNVEQHWNNIVFFNVELNNVRQRWNNVVIFNIDFHNVGQRRNNVVNMNIWKKYISLDSKTK